MIKEITEWFKNAWTYVVIALMLTAGLFVAAPLFTGAGDVVVVTGGADNYTITTTAYTFNLYECVGASWKDSSGLEYLRVNNSDAGLGDVYVGGFLTRIDIDSTSQLITDSDSYAFFQCNSSGATSAKINWTFYETYLNMEYQVDGVSRLYSYLLHNNTGTPVGTNYNSSQSFNAVSPWYSWLTITSYDGVMGFVNTAQPNNFVAMSWNAEDTSILVDASTNTGSGDYENGWSIGRNAGDTIAANQTVSVNFKIISTSYGVTNALTEFKADPLFGDSDPIPEYNYRNYLVSEYRFENSSNLAYDTGLAGNHGAVVGSLTNTTIALNNALGGWSDSNYIYVPDADSLDIADNLTVCMWRYNPATNDWDTSVMRYSTSSNQRLWNVQTTSGEYQGFTLGSVTGASQIQTDGLAYSSPYGNYFMCGTYSSTQTNSSGAVGVGKIYINGSEVSGYTNQVNNSYGLNPTQTVPLIIGRSNYTTGRYDRGRLDEITIWNKSLNDAEISNLFTNYLAGYHASDTDAPINPPIILNASIDSGSLESYSAVGYDVTAKFQEDIPGCTGYDQCTGWAFFQIQNGESGEELRLTFDNYVVVTGAYWTQSQAQPYLSCNISDDSAWTRTGTKYQLGSYVYLNITLPCDEPYFASWLPYWVGRINNTITHLNTSTNQSYTNISVIGDTVDGRPLYGIIVTDESVPNTNKRSVVVVGGLHASETLGNIFVEGLLESLMNYSDSNIATFLDNYVVYVVPTINADGIAEGYGRYNPEGFDPNRCWDDNNCQEVDVAEAWLVSINATITNKLIGIDAHGNGGSFVTPTLLYDNFSSSLIANISARTTIDDGWSSTGTSYATGKGYLKNQMKIPVAATLEYTQRSTRNYSTVKNDAREFLLAIMDTYGTTDVCSYSGSGDWNLDATDECVVNSPVNVAGNIVLSNCIDGSITRFTSQVNVSGYVYKPAGSCVLYFDNGVLFKS